MKNLLIRTKLLLFSGIAITGLVLFSIIAYTTLQRLKVNGPEYYKIILGKDLIADILPPPEYILEPAMIALEMLQIEDEKTLVEKTEYYNRLTKDYEVRHQYWIDNLPESSMKENLIKNSYEPASKFFTLFSEEYLPALNQKNVAQSKEILTQKLLPLYYEHRIYIDKVVAAANQMNTDNEIRANKLIQSS